MDIDAAVERFLEGRRRGEFFPPEWDGPLTLTDAYRIQLGVLDHHLASGRGHIGWKVGLTAKPIQEQFNVHEPGFGFLLDSAPHPSGATIRAADIEKPGLENELCLVLGTSLEGPGATREQAAAAVSAVHPAFEIIETRGDARGSIIKGVVDNLQQWGIVTGPAFAYDGSLDLASVHLSLDIDGTSADEADGSAVLGQGPAASLAWLANRLAVFGRRVEAGQLVMTGSFTRQYPVIAGQGISAAFDPIGEVRVAFA